MKEPSDNDFDSISPSAKSLLLTKALTTIPFAKEAVELIWGKNGIKSAQARLSSIGFLLRLIHFEARYLSITKALTELETKNILEFSSGYSFRGLNFCKNSGIYYIDTDLPQLIEIKKVIVKELAKKYCNYPLDNLFLNALNVLDENAFTEIMNGFPTGSVILANEGLLVYLDESQKRKLCKIIHNLLSLRNGYWITADIYIKKEPQQGITNSFYEERGKRFLDEHNIEANKFETFKVAEVFFKKCGFEIFKKIEVPSSNLSSTKLLRKIPHLKIEDIKGRKKVRETWILKTNS